MEPVAFPPGRDASLKHTDCSAPSDKAASIMARHCPDQGIIPRSATFAASTIDSVGSRIAVRMAIVVRPGVQSDAT
ncbi:hypothetical protein PDK10_27675, partial [Bacillus cereus]|nr:hypothetical protein [Bacillus cereus]